MLPAPCWGRHMLRLVWAHPLPAGLGAGGRLGQAKAPARAATAPSRDPMCFLHFPIFSWAAGPAAQVASSRGGGGDPSLHRDPRPGQQHPLSERDPKGPSCLSPAASNGGNYSLTRAIPAESLAALVLPRLLFHPLISSSSDPLPALRAHGESSGSLR